MIIDFNTPEKKTQEIEEKVTQLKQTTSLGEFTNIANAKLLLRKLEESKEDQIKVKEFANQLNSQFLNFSFNHTNSSVTEYRNDLQEIAQTKPLSSLTPSQHTNMSLQTALDGIYTNKSLNNLNPEFIKKLDVNRFGFDKNIELICRILKEKRDINKIKGIHDLINKLAKQKGYKFIEDFIWPRLTLKVKEELIYPINILFYSKDLYMKFLTEKFDLDNHNIEDEDQVKKFKELGHYIKDINPIYNQIKRGVNQALLILQEKSETVEKLTLINYLKAPFVIRGGWIRETHFKNVFKLRAENREEDMGTFSVFKNDDDQLIENCLKQLFRTEKSFSEFEEFVDPLKLKKLFWKERLFNGEECSNPKQFFTESELESLFSMRELKFEKKNKKKFSKNDKVDVEVSVKNVSKLIVRVFEANTLNFILQTNTQDYETIDVSGLIPTGEYEYHYEQNPIVIHKENFRFQNIESCDAGVFIIDFIGEEIKSRCVIYRGQLNLIYEKNHGRSCMIMDKNGQVCKGKGTGIYIGETFFESDQVTGVITVPITVGNIEQNVIAIHKGFADFCKLKTRDPNPKFSSKVVFNSEEFLAGNKVKFLIEPRLNMYDNLAPLSFISNLSVSIVTTNDQNVQNKTDFNNLKAAEDKDIMVEMIFPPKIMNITVEVTADLNINREPQKLKSSQQIDIIRKLGDSTYQLLFQKSQNEEVKLFILGKNGEPRKNMCVNANIRIKHSTNEFKYQLVSDENGICNFGEIENLDTILAVCGNESASYSSCSKSFNIYPVSLLLRENEEWKIPLDTENVEVMFFELNSEEKIKEEVPRTSYTIANKHLLIKGLLEGNYHLILDDQFIKISVVKGEFLHDQKLLWTKKKIHMIDQKPKIWFQSKKEKEDYFEFEVISENKNLKARLLTYNFLPNEYEYFKTISNHSLPDLRNSISCNPNFGIRNIENTYSNQIRLGDELIYVYDRKTKKNFMGNTLQKPGVILKRARVGETKETEQKVNAGQNDVKMDKYCDDKKDKKMKRKSKHCSASSNCDQKIRLNPSVDVKEFIGNPGQLHGNLDVADGIIRIEKSLIDKYAFSFLYISDGFFSSFIPVTSNSKSIQLTDCSLKESKKDGFIYAYSREVRYLKAKQELKVENISNTQMYLITSLKDLFDSFETLLKNKNIDFKEWSFLCSWNFFAPMEKLKKYDKFGSHELNIFLYLKDREFFEEVVKPFLVNKKEKQIVDFFLLEDYMSCAKFFNISYSKNLNILEQVLLAVLAKKTHPDFSKATLNYFKSSTTLNRTPLAEVNTLFEALLNINSESITKVKVDNDGLLQTRECKIQSGKMSNSSNSAPPLPGMTLKSMNLKISVPEKESAIRLGGVMKKCAKTTNCNYINRRYEDSNDLCFAQNEQIYSEGKPIFTKTQGTVEYKERQYFVDNFDTKINDFWTDLLQHMLSEHSNQNFGSKNFLKSVSTLPEFIAAISFIDLPFEKAVFESSVSNNTLKLNTNSNIYVLTKEVIEKKGELFDLEVLCSQKIYDPEDPVIYDDEDPELFHDKPVDEYLTSKVYASRVVITNSTTTRIKVNLIVEIPEGSIPIGSLDALQIKDFTIDQFRSQVIETKFYFPNAGEFNLFPSSVVSNGKIVSSAKKIPKIVVRCEKSRKDLKTISDVLSNGKIDDIIEFINSKNLLNPKIFRFDQIYWLLKNKAFYDRLTSICEEKGIFDLVVWSYSIVHGDYKRLKELLQNNANGNKFGFLKFINSDVLSRDTFKIREYYPLINPRAHLLGSSKTNIINDVFKKTYEEFLLYLFHKFTPSNDDLILLIDYLIAQDQIEKALELTKLIKEEEMKNNVTKVQFDYQTAYLNFITGYPDFAKAKTICERYLTYPVLSIRNLFVEIANQLSEFEESDLYAKSKTKQEGDLLNKQKSAKVPSFTSSLEGQKFKFASTMVGSLVLKFYKVEVEVIFSQNPFNFESKKSFTYVSPFYETIVKTNDENDLTVNHFEIPQLIRQENLFIEIRSANEQIQKSEFFTSS